MDIYHPKRSRTHHDRTEFVLNILVQLGEVQTLGEGEIQPQATETTMKHGDVHLQRT